MTFCNTWLTPWVDLKYHYYDEMLRMDQLQIYIARLKT